jgi:tetratricopeptide (TPR) repeat protein
MLVRKLRAERHLLVLDNLESITGTNLAVGSTLPTEEREALRRFLAGLAGGRTLVLLGSRGGEEWLAPGTFGESVYDLPGLDPEAASVLADRILERYGAARYRGDDAFRRLLKLLAGYPLAMEVVLANLARQTPAQVLEALQAGDVALDTGDAESKTRSILRCIDYSHGNLDPDVQGLLICLAPFTSVLNTRILPAYSEALQSQDALSSLPFERWDDVIRQAEAWGLMSPHPEAPGFFQLQPTLPYFLRNRLGAAENEEAREAIESAFQQTFDKYADEIYTLLTSKQADSQAIGRVLASLEFENLYHALRAALARHRSIMLPYIALSKYLDIAQHQMQGLSLSEEVLSGLAKYPPDITAGEIGAEVIGILDQIAKRQLLLKRFAEAESTYRRALNQWTANNHFDTATKRRLSASIYHQLGMVAQAQRKWDQAEQHYRQALEISIEFNNRYEQASTFHQLGMVAQAQRQWDQAEQHYHQALEIKIEFNDRYSQASTYHQLGMVAQEQRQWDQGEQHYRQALEIYIEFNDRYEQAGTYHQLGRVAQAQRQWEQAQTDLLQALDIFLSHKDQHNASIALRNLANLWKDSGDDGVAKETARLMNATPEQVREFFESILA